MDGLWTNRRASKDPFEDALSRYWSSASAIDIAVAFFTDEAIVEDLISENGCHVRMVVRLGFPTKPPALRALIKKRDVELRYYSDSAFHPKLYIFDDKIALLGSANLTQKALRSNQEIMISIKSEDPRFGELTGLFSDYWDNSQVLTTESLKAYEKIYKEYGRAIDDINRIDEAVQSKIGKTGFPNIDRDKPTESRTNIPTAMQELVHIDLRGNMVSGTPPQPDYRRMPKGKIARKIELDSVCIGSVCRLNDGLYRVALRKNKTFKQLKALKSQITLAEYKGDYEKILRMRYDSQEEAGQNFEKYLRSFPDFDLQTLRFSSV